MEKELLQLLADQTGCSYISDLHDPEKFAGLVNILPALPADRYTLWTWSDAVAYITGQDRHFSDQFAAKAFLQRFCEKGMNEIN